MMELSNVVRQEMRGYHRAGSCSVFLLLLLLHFLLRVPLIPLQELFFSLVKRLLFFLLLLLSSFCFTFFFFSILSWSRAELREMSALTTAHFPFSSRFICINRTSRCSSLPIGCEGGKVFRLVRRFLRPEEFHNRCFHIKTE